MAIASSSSTCDIANPTWISTQSPGSDALAVVVEQADVDRALDAGHVDLREAVRLVDDLDDLAGDGQAHVDSSQLGVRGDPTPGGRAPKRAGWNPTLHFQHPRG